MAQEYLPAPSNIRLADLMKEHDISQPELAKEIGCSKSTISRFISGTKGTLTHEQVLKIARLFNVSTDFLLGETNIPDRKTATAMATASAKSREAAKLKEQLGFNAKHATVKAVHKATSTVYAWLALRTWCKANGESPKTVTDPLYGDVKAWPAGAWDAVYGISLEELFGEVVA